MDTKPRLEPRTVTHANHLFSEWLAAARAEEDTFADTPAEARASRKTLRRYETLVNYLDSHGMAGGWLDPRGELEEAPHPQ
jgi:hypothetical protein